MSLTPEREQEIRKWYSDSTSKRAVVLIAKELLSEIDALRAENNYLKTEFQPHPTQEACDRVRKERDQLYAENHDLKELLVGISLGRIHVDRT